MNPFAYSITMIIVFGIMAFVGQSRKAKNVANEKKSRFYNMTAEEAEKSYNKRVVLWSLLPICIGLGLLIALAVVIAVIPHELLDRGNLPIIILAIVFGLFIILMVISLVMSLAATKDYNAIIERDCDVDKGIKVMEIRIEKTKKNKARKAAFMCELAHCYALSNDELWATKAVEKLKEVDEFYKKAQKLPNHMNTRLKLAARQENINDINSCINRLKHEKSSLGKTIPVEMINGLLEEAEIHKLMVNKNYAQAVPAIRKHIGTGDVPLSYVYMHYYLAIIALTNNNSEEAQTHIEYVRNNGGTTYYMNDLKKRFGII